MPEQERVRIEVAFDGGPIIGAFATVASVERCEQAHGRRGRPSSRWRWTTARCIVAIKRVVYFKRFARESRVGFGS